MQDSKHTANIEWHIQPQDDFLKGRYSRRHVWRFDGGQELHASASPHVVPLPWSDASVVDPEEAYIASLASCHMLWFLSIAAKHGHVVQHYQDNACGILERDEQGKLWISTVILRPVVVFSGKQPSHDSLIDLHHLAHAECFIANSVRTHVRCEPVLGELQ